MEDGIPAQFIYEEADCRIFYTPEMVVDVAAMWRAAADVAWGSKTCVAGAITVGKGVGKRVLSDRLVERRPAEEREVARRLLEDVRGRIERGEMDAGQRVRGWEGIHGRRVPV